MPETQEPFDPSDMKFVFTLRIPPASPDSSGDGSAGAWADGVTFFGSLLQVSAGEFDRGISLQRELSHRIRCRWRAAITQKNRLMLGTREFAIIGLREMDDVKKYMEITVLEGPTNV